MKKGTPTLALFLLAIFLCSCQSANIPDSNMPDNDVSTPYNQGAESKSIYQLNKSVIELEGHVEIEPLIFPDKINNMKTAVSNVVSDTQLLMILYEENPLPIIKEVGVYDLNNQKYSHSFSVPENKTIAIVSVTNGLIVYKEIDNLTNNASLNCYDLKTGENSEIYVFSPEYSSSSVSYNSIVNYNGKIYFDDIVSDGDDVIGVNLLAWDIKTKSIDLYKPNSQNPILLNSELMYISKNQKTGLCFIESSQHEKIIQLSERISVLASATDELYSINNKGNDPQTMRTIWSVNSLLEDEEILLASNAIDLLVANQFVVAWRNFTPEKPIIYLRNLDSFTILLENEIAYNTYLLGDKSGILICSHDNTPTTYYRFTYS